MKHRYRYRVKMSRCQTQISLKAIKVGRQSEPCRWRPLFCGDSRWSTTVDLRSQNRQSTVHNNNSDDRNSWRAVRERKGSDTALSACLRVMRRRHLLHVFFWGPFLFRTKTVPLGYNITAGLSVIIHWLGAVETRLAGRSAWVTTAPRRLRSLPTEIRRYWTWESEWLRQHSA